VISERDSLSEVQAVGFGRFFDNAEHKSLVGRVALQANDI